ncbi:MAG: DUF664 domain-containing protein [Ilumatobacteraceae bacterium]
MQAHRGFLRHTISGLTDDQARSRPTASQLSLAPIVKHVTATEASWIRFVLGDAEAMASDPEAWAEEWRAGDDETVDVLLARYDEVAAYRRPRAFGARSRRPPAAAGGTVVPPGPLGRPGGCSSTSSPRPRSTPVTPTSSVRRSTVRRPWVENPQAPAFGASVTKGTP